MALAANVLSVVRRSSAAASASFRMRGVTRALIVAIFSARMGPHVFEVDVKVYVDDTPKKDRK